MATRARKHKVRPYRSAKQQRPFTFLIIAAVVGAAAAVALLIGLQAFDSDGGGDLPPRVARGEGRVLGDEDAPLTVIEYADFQCPVCKRAESSVLAQIERDYVTTGQVKIEFRMFPFLGQESFDAAQAAEAAREQGKFWEYHDALFNAQRRENSGAFAYDKLVAIAREVGLDIAMFERALANNTYLKGIQDEADAARDAGVNSTPVFFVGDTKIVGAQPYEVFQAEIDRALHPSGGMGGTR
jgi:protein-disulfide isomerase